MFWGWQLNLKVAFFLLSRFVLWRVEKKRRSMIFTSPVSGLSALTDGCRYFSTSPVILRLKVCLFYHFNVRWRMMSVIIFSMAETGISDVSHDACPQYIVTILISFLCFCVLSPWSRLDLLLPPPVCDTLLLSFTASLYIYTYMNTVSVCICHAVLMCFELSRRILKKV